MNVAWAFFWGGSRSTKPCVFPCKVASAGDERYLLCAACGCDRFGRNRFSLGVLQHVGANRIAMAAWICVGGAAKRGVMAAWLLHGACFGEEAGRGTKLSKLYVFPCKVAAAGDERYLLCAAVAGAIVSGVIGSRLVFCNVWWFKCA